MRELDKFIGLYLTSQLQNYMIITKDSEVLLKQEVEKWNTMEQQCLKDLQGMKLVEMIPIMHLKLKWCIQLDAKKVNRKGLGKFKRDMSRQLLSITKEEDLSKESKDTFSIQSN